MFETMDAQDLNKRLKDLMDGLSVKVRQMRSSTLATSSASDQALILADCHSHMLAQACMWRSLQCHSGSQLTLCLPCC